MYRRADVHNTPLRCVWLSMVVALGCGDNPCPKGWRRTASEDRCIAPGSDGLAPDGGLVADGGEIDSARPPLHDGGPPAADSGPPSGPAPDASAIDGGEPDASGDGTDAACADVDLAAWRAFQLGGTVVAATEACVDASPPCPGPRCDLHTCLADRAGMSGCAPCVAEQVACTVSACFDACSPGRGDDACRACACAAGCMETFQRCAGQALDVCADCSGGTCTNQSLDVALIMVIVGYP
jgi:hypothetical protein